MTKYSNDVYIKADNTIRIGLYSMDSELNAKKMPAVVKIFGGTTYATHKIVTGSICNCFKKTNQSIC